MPWSVNPQLKQVDDPIKSYHNHKVTEATIKELLKDGTPDWVRFPNDYKNFAKEAFAAEKQASDDMVLGYKMGDEDILTNYKARAVNIIGTRDFVLKLRNNGIKCFTIYNGLPGTVGLWVIVPTFHGIDVRYICYMQIPAQIEWSVLRLDKHGLPNGEDYRGWRTVVSQLIRKNVLTEQRAHEIFGPPTDSIVSRRYRQTLWFHRHRKENVPVQDGF